MCNLINNHEPRQQNEYRFRCADGAYKTVLDRSFILFNEQGKAVRVICSMQDISERIRDMHAIAAQNVRLREISWIQAHEVRAPVAKIMGLSEILNLEPVPAVQEIVKISQMIHVSALEVDQVIRAILEKSK